MLEKIGAPGYETISHPDPVVLRLLDEILAREPAPVVYEVGVGVGATTLPVARAMANRGQLVLFSRKADVRELAGDLAALGLVNVNADWGSDGHTFSGYHFELARGFAAGALPAFDLAYLDGGHVFHLDAPAALVLKELCKPGGYLVLDDYSWSLACSPTQNPAVRPQTARDFDPGQIAAAHVELVCRVVMDTDPRFVRVGVENNSCIYRRCGD